MSSANPSLVLLMVSITAMVEPDAMPGQTKFIAGFTQCKRHHFPASSLSDPCIITQLTSVTRVQTRKPKPSPSSQTEHTSSDIDSAASVQPARAPENLGTVSPASLNTRRAVIGHRTVVGGQYPSSPAPFTVSSGVMVMHTGARVSASLTSSRTESSRSARWMVRRP